MKKKFSLILAFIIIFSCIGGNTYLASSEETLNQDEMKYEIQSVLDEIELNVEKNIKSIEDNEKIDMESSIDKSIKDNEDMANTYSIQTFQEKDQSLVSKIRDRYIQVTNLIERQYNFKKTFVQNTRQSYQLIKQLEKDFLNISSELRSIFNDESVNLPEEDFYKIMSELKSLNLELKNSDYQTGNITKEYLNYIKLIFSREISLAANQFELIVQEQFKQIKLLENSLIPINNIKSILN